MYLIHGKPNLVALICEVVANVHVYLLLAQIPRHIARLEAWVYFSLEAQCSLLAVFIHGRGSDVALFIRADPVPEVLHVGGAQRSRRRHRVRACLRLLLAVRGWAQPVEDLAGESRG